MTDRFIIVIEADNKRAHAAYVNGLTDLDLIWPQIERHSEKAYKQECERAAKLNVGYEEERARFRADMDAHQEALEKWEQSSSFFRGERPSMPSRYNYLVHFHRQPYIPSNPLNYYKSVRAELKRMADLAGAALGPFRMTEQKVAEMIEWEDGSRIERIKAEITARASESLPSPAG